MSEMPDDIMQTASKAYFDAFDENDQASIHAVLRNIGSAILSERQRHAEVMEEVRKVLEPFAREAANWWPAASDERFVSGETAIKLSHLRAARALLSRLEER